MPNTKRDKYGEVAKNIQALYHQGVYVGETEKISAILRSAFPETPPAEDAKALAISLCDIYDPPYMRKDFAIQRAAAEIESFAQLRVEPWREALNWVTHLLCGQGKRGGAPESGEIEDATDEARALLSDSPAQDNKLS
jgi:hypothetical protein